MALDKKALAAAKRFTSDTADSLGAVKGAPCTIKSITEVDGGQKVTFEWTGTSGTKQTSEMTVKNGVSVTGINDKGNGVFTLLFSDGSESSPIQTIKGQKGDKGDKLTFNDLTDEEKASLKGSDGFSPSAKVEKVGDTATITITDKDGTTTATIKDGQGGTGGSGEENKINSISVNGVNVVPDENKNVDITVPSIEGLTKDADLATVAKSGDYEDLSNKPTIPSLDGYAKTSEIPSKVSELENDSNYLSSIPEEYVTETELSAKGYLTEHQDISGKVDKVEGKSLISDTEIARLASVDNYDDTDIKAELAKKADATAIPSKVSELTNDNNYQTAEQVNSTVTTEIAKVVADAPESLNTLKEMSDWIAGHEDDASAMNSAISDNKTAITALQTGKADKSEIPTTVAELTDSADYAKKTDLHSHTNKTVLDGVTEEKVTAWDKAQENIIESVKINNQEITPDENKAVNIDLTGYAEHDEIVGENLIPFPYAQPERTTNGITFTFADDGSVIANGTATADADFSVCVRTNFGTDKAFMLKPGTYAITGCPEGGSDSTYRIHVQFGDKTGVKYGLKADYGKGFVFEVTEEHAKYACQIQCHVQRGYTATDLVFKPMLVLGSVLKEYQPYKLSRESLRKDIADVTELASRVDTQFSTASGDYITVADSVDGNIVELNIKGKSIQNQYTGKNLITYPFSQTTQTKYGVTFTDNKNGSINISGTQDGSTTRPYMGLGIWWNETDKKTGNIPIPANTDFTISSNCGSNTAGLRYYIYDESGAKLADNTVYGTSTKTLKFDVEVWVALCVETAANGAVYSCECKPQLELGTTATEYEPYVGGIPSPNPLYPQEINSVGDDGSLVVKSCGKNLIPYPYDDGVRTSVGLTTTPLPNGMVSVSGTNTGISGLFNFNYPTRSIIKLDPSKTYAFFNPLKTDRKDQITLGIRWYLEGQELSTSTGTNTNIINNRDSNGAIIRSGFSYAYVYLYGYNSGKTFNNVLFAPMLVEVNEDGTYPTEYEIYKSSTSTIPLSEPLRSIGDIKDEITYQDGKWGVIRRIKEFGISDMSIQTPGNFGDVNYTYTAMTTIGVAKPDSPLLSNLFTDKGYLTVRNNNVIGCGCQSDGNVIFGVGKESSITTIELFTQWASDNDLKLQFILATPVFEPFADQTLQYLSTYDGVTNISNDDALSAEMTVKYPTTDASGVGSQNESRIAELSKDTDDKFDDVNESLSVIGKCKNLLNPTLQTTTQDGVTCTNNSDGTYTLNGTCSVDSPKTTIIVTSESMKIDEDVKFICCTQSGSSDTFRASVDYDDGTYSVDYGEGTLLSKGKTITKVSIIVSNGATVNNLVFKPMLTTNLNATYDDFVPYTGDGDTLTHDVAEIKNDLDKKTKSHLTTNYVNITSYNSTNKLFTVPKDGYVRLSADSSSKIDLYIRTVSGTFFGMSTITNEEIPVFLRKGCELYVSTTGTASAMFWSFE